MDIAQFIQLEAELLDERKWDEWLALYDADTEYWVPAWDDDGAPTSDPQRELSLIYYRGRGGLEDRVHRLRTGHSSASSPLFRTCHLRSPPLLGTEGELQSARFAWTTHCYRPGESVSYFGRKTLWLAARGNGYAIMKSITMVHNDLIDQVLDVYQL